MTTEAAPFDYSLVSHRGRPLVQRASRQVLLVALRVLVRLEIQGMENLPVNGGFILAANHLHALDPAIGLLLVPRRVVGIVKEKWNRPPFRWLLRGMSDVVFVGGSHRRPLDEAVSELQGGAVVAILPEGTRSRTATMGAGQRGVGMLAVRAQVPVVPAGAFGQEAAGTFWRRGRRVPVHVSIGTAMAPPRRGAGKLELERYTDEVMLAIAGLVPEPYRGVYGRRA